MKTKCECGKEITKQRDKQNDDIAEKTKTTKLDMCDECWDSYCEHATTGN